MEKQLNGQHRTILLLIMLLAPLGGLCIDIYAPSLPSIAHFFKTSSQHSQNTMISYVIGLGVGQLFFGIVSDTISRKRLLVAGIFGFILFSLLCAISHSINALLIYRLIQGIFAASAGTVGKAIMSDNFTGEALKKVSTYWIITWALGPILAPLLGGFFQHTLDWQYSFVFLTVYGIVLLGASWLAFSTIKNQKRRGIKNVISTIIRTLFIKEFFIGILNLTLIYTYIVSFSLAGPFTIQMTFHFSAIEYGYIAFGLGFAFFIGALLKRNLLQNSIGNYVPGLYVIMLLLGVMMILLTMFFPLAIYPAILVIFFVFLISSLIIPNLYVLCLDATKHHKGVASALMSFIPAIGAGAFGVLIKHADIGSFMPLAITYTLGSAISLLSIVLTKVIL